MDEGNSIISKPKAHHKRSLSRSPSYSNFNSNTSNDQKRRRITCNNKIQGLSFSELQMHPQLPNKNMQTGHHKEFTQFLYPETPNNRPLHITKMGNENSMMRKHSISEGKHQSLHIMSEHNNTMTIQHQNNMLSNDFCENNNETNQDLSKHSIDKNIDNHLPYDNVKHETKATISSLNDKTNKKIAGKSQSCSSALATNTNSQNNHSMSPDIRNQAYSSNNLDESCLNIKFDKLKRKNKQLQMQNNMLQHKTSQLELQLTEMTAKYQRLINSFNLAQQINASTCQPTSLRLYVHADEPKTNDNAAVCINIFEEDGDDSDSNSNQAQLK